MRKLKVILKKALAFVFHKFQSLGLDILPRNFYSEIPDLRCLRRERGWRKAFSMRGVAGVDLNKQLANLKSWFNSSVQEKILHLSIHEEACKKNGEPGYGPVEAEVLFAYVASRQPAQIFQIGCGVSTAVCLLAAEFAGYKPAITCVEPYPTQFLREMGAQGKVRLIREKGKNGLVEGRKLDGAAVVWAIRRIYDASIGEEPEPEHEAVADQPEETNANAYEEIPPLMMDGGAPPRKMTMLEVFDPSTNGKRSLRLANVPGVGDCMFVSLEVAAFGKDKSSTRNGIWMRTKIVSMMRQILSKNDDRAKELYEDMKLHINNISPEVKDEAEKALSKKLYTPTSSSSSSSPKEEGKGYAERMAGYLD
ncbi:hypothetical protein EBT31_21755, partial [bacterium]|nr:hypothetical protein [bacterium]